MSQGSSPGDSWPPAPPTRAHIESRLAALKAEYEKGQVQLQRVQAQLTDVQQTLLRLSGAITVLEELLVPVSAGSSESKEAKRDRNELAADRK